MKTFVIGFFVTVAPPAGVPACKFETKVIWLFDMRKITASSPSTSIESPANKSDISTMVNLFGAMPVSTVVLGDLNL